MNNTPNLSLTQSWVLAIRPATLLTGLAPVLLGLAFGLKPLLYGARTLRASHVLVSLVACLLVIFLQSAANMVNDAKDAEKGIDTQHRLGPTRVVQSGLLSHKAVTLAYSLCFAMAAIIVLGLFFYTKDWLVIGVATLCGLAAYLYTAGPFPLAYYALGEVIAFVFFGPVAVMGTAYLQTGIVDPSVAVWGSGCGFISAAIMAINNFRDRQTDARAGKHTLATLLGHNLAKKLPIFFVGIALLVLFFYCATHQVIGLGVLGVVGGASYVAKRLLPALNAKGAAINLGLKITAQFNLFYALYFILCVSVASL